MEYPGHRRERAFKAKHRFYVPAKSLDSYFHHGERVNLVKIDVQGAETLGFRGMRRILRECRPVLVIEFHNDDAWVDRQILIDTDYRIFNIHGELVDSGLSTPRQYHALALPCERLNLAERIRRGTEEDP